MRSMKRRVGYGYVVGRAGVALAGVYVLLTPVFAQDAQEPDWSRIAGNFGEVKVLLYRHGFLGQPGECIHAAVVSANARRTTAGARKPSRSINHCWL